MDTPGNVATITNFTVFTAPIMAVEAALLAALGILYYLAIHTNSVKNDWLAARLFIGFHAVWRWLVTGLICCAVLFALALVMRGPNAIALRDTSLTLFLFVGWSGILCGAWNVFMPKPSRRKPRLTKYKKPGSGFIHHQKGKRP